MVTLQTRHRTACPAVDVGFGAINNAIRTSRRGAAVVVAHPTLAITAAVAMATIGAQWASSTAVGIALRAVVHAIAAVGWYTMVLRAHATVAMLVEGAFYAVAGAVAHTGRAGPHASCPNGAIVQHAAPGLATAAAAILPGAAVGIGAAVGRRGG